MLSGALRLPDVHDDEPGDDPGNPCPVCTGPVEGGSCFICGAVFCSECGQAELPPDAACCIHCAPVYSVTTTRRPYYLGRNLRRAFEAQSYLHAAGLESASITVPRRVRLDHDGLTNREVLLLKSWDAGFTLVHTCIAPTKVQP